MRVLHLVPSLDMDTGGPARSVPALCRALQDLGLEVTLMSFGRARSPVTVTGREPFQVQWQNPWPGTRQFPTPSFYRELRHSLGQFDLVHLHSFWNAAVDVAALACRRSRIPYLISPRGMLQETAVGRKGWLKKTYHAAWGQRTLQGAALLHFFTQAEARDSSQFLRGEKAAQVIIPNGIDLELGAGASQDQFLKDFPKLAGKRIMLFVGRLHWSKGLDLQAQALELLAPKFPDLVWVLAGPDEGEWPRLSRYLQQRGLAERALWTGLLPRQQCLDALAAANVFVLTSRHEAHSMAMNEALAVGIPVVITDSVQFEAVQEYGAGLVAASQPAALAEAVANVLEHPEKASDMRQSCRRLAAEQLAWPRVAERMAAAYRQVLDGARQSGVHTEVVSTGSGL